ncbi:hypothetical protein N7451_002871 [Penicillium sp. IBT 35674x]|nr:hypothetical protein N7451_002871 [Penicillium sp. IBT 35674x]
MPIQWDREADAKLINALATTGSPDFEAVAKAMGEGVTVSAIKHRLVRIREAAGIPSAREAKKNKASTSAKLKSSDDRSSAKSTSTNSKSRSMKNPASTAPVHAGKGMKASNDTSSVSSAARSWGGKTVLKSITPTVEDYGEIKKDEDDENLFYF